MTGAEPIEVLILAGRLLSSEAAWASALAERLGERGASARLLAISVEPPIRSKAPWNLDLGLGSRWRRPWTCRRLAGPRGLAVPSLIHAVGAEAAEPARRLSKSWDVPYVLSIGEFLAPRAVPTAIVAGVAAGLVIGTGQGLVLRRVRDRVLMPWAAASALGLGVGLAIGSAVVDYGTTASDLVVQGMICGLGVGCAQAAVLAGPLGRAAAAAWALSVTVLWPLGWMVTRFAGVQVSDRFAVFGASGALVFCALSGCVLVALIGMRRS